HPFFTLSINQGQSNQLQVAASGGSPLSYQWMRDGAALPDATASTLFINNAQAADAGSYHVVVSDASGSINSRTGVVTVNLIFPDSFSTNTIIANVLCALPLPDGKTLIGGNFVRIGNQDRIRLARFNADGTLDSTFTPGASNTVYALSLQPDGRMLVGGA